MRPVLSSLLLTTVVLGCATPEVLPPRDGDAPDGVDFTGQWKMRPESTQGQPRVAEAIDRTDGVDSKTIMREMLNRQRNAQRGRPGSGETRGGLVGIFLQTGNSLKITQTPHGLFISFDRAIVEEYRFGEYRPISVGQADAMRTSGWDGETYVIDTLGEKGMKLTDRYELSPDGERLIRHITLRSKEMEEVTIVQEFDRQPD
jgi:hypothetical protein